MGAPKAKPKISVVCGPNGKFYKVGSEIELCQCYNEKGKKAGMFWFHKTTDLKWEKKKNDVQFLDN